jgi:hypothetical protein
MKDAKGHGSNTRGGIDPRIAGAMKRVAAAHQTGVQAAAVKSTMKALVDSAKARGVNLDIEDLGTPLQWHLAYIERQGGAPGTGAAVIKDIHAAADKLGATVQVEPMGNSKGLHTYYKNLGYRDNGERGEEGEPHMVRKPH